MSPDELSELSAMARDLLDRGQPEKALAVLEQATQVPPEYPEIRFLTAEGQLACGRGEDAVIIFEALVREHPANVLLRMRFGQVLQILGDLPAAQIEYRNALMLVPRNQAVPREMHDLYFLANDFCDFDCMRDFGDTWSFFESIPAMSLRSFFLRIFPHAVSLEDNRRMVSLYRKWAVSLDADAAQAPLPGLAPAYAGGTLRIGFLASLNIVNNVAKFILPIFDALRTHEDCEIAYFTTIAPFAGDPIQDQVRRIASVFEDVSRLDVRSAAQTIRNAGCHVVIDCDGHARWSKTAALCYRPARLQASFINWPGTLGLGTVDSIVVDRNSNPPVRGTLIESPLVLDGFIGPHVDPEEPAREPPFCKNGFMTFGTQSAPYKITPALVSLWSEVLRETDGSHFLIVRPECGNAAFVDNMRREFQRHSISSERLLFIDNSKTSRTHLSFYDEMDIFLDSIPLNGGTTTFEALWMGTPVITYAGPGVHQRLSHSILCELGLGDLSGNNSADYIENAGALARDPERLRRLKTTLRSRIEASSMLDARRYATQLKQQLVNRLLGNRGEKVHSTHGIGGPGARDKKGESVGPEQAAGPAPSRNRVWWRRWKG